MTAGVYAIRNTTTGRSYIGSTIHLKQRWAEHRTDLNHGRGAKCIQADWITHGPDSFVIVVLEEIASPDTGALERAEQRWLDHFIELATDLYNTRRQVWRQDNRIGAVRDRARRGKEAAG